MRSDIFGDTGVSSCTDWSHGMLSIGNKRQCACCNCIWPCDRLVVSVPYWKNVFISYQICHFNKILWIRTLTTTWLTRFQNQNNRQYRYIGSQEAWTCMYMESAIFLSPTRTLSLTYRSAFGLVVLYHVQLCIIHSTWAKSYCLKQTFKWFIYPSKSTMNARWLLANSNHNINTRG